MAAIRISPVPLRAAGLAFVAGADEVSAQAGALRSIAMPAMPPAMAAAHEAALEGAASRLALAASECEQVGQELQVRAAAAELADTPTESRALAAALQVRQSVAVTSVVGSGNRTTTARITIARNGSASAVTGSGRRLTLGSIIDSGYARSSDTASAGLPERATREIDPHRSIGGRPAVAVSYAVSGGEGDGGAASVSASSSSSAVAGIHADAIDPANIPEAEQRAEHHDGTGALAPAEAPEPSGTDRQSWACWMASVAEKEGVPPVLPVMLAMAASGLRNVGEVDGRVGVFGLDVDRAYAPPGVGMPMDSRPTSDWWEEHPEAQLERVLNDLRTNAGGIRDVRLDDEEALARWAQSTSVDVDPSSLAESHAAATDMVGECARGGGALPSPGGSSALDAARHEMARGVREVGVNAGPDVDRYLAAANVGSGNPWCASFVTWSLQQAGHELPGNGWAAVSTWVRAAEEGLHGLQIVDASAAQPGDIVAYDWSGGRDFGADGHIGFLESKVEDGSFTAVEGNAEDAVSRMQRNMGMGEVVFIRPSA